MEEEEEEELVVEGEVEEIVKIRITDVADGQDIAAITDT